MKTIITAIQSSDYVLAGKELAKDQNGKSVKQSVLFSSIGREFAKAGLCKTALLSAINKFADTARENIDNKQDLSRNLKTYVLRGFNDQSAKDHKSIEPVKVLHFWGEHKKPAVFTFECEPAKAPKVKTASGKSDAQTGDGAPDSSKSQPEKEAEILEKITLSITDIENAYKKGAFTLSDLSAMMDRLTAMEIAKAA